MPRRDGSPTEEEIARQRAGQGAPPVPVSALRDPEEENATALALTAAAAGVATVATPVALSLASAGILNAFDRFLRDRRATVEAAVMDLLEVEAPTLSMDERATITDTEIEAEKAYQGKALARLSRDLPKALMVSDPTIREMQVEAVLERERRIARQREEAVAMRALGSAEVDMVLAESPEGAFWHLSPHVREHTPDCLAMGGKAWPPSVLRRFHPPVHYGCECELVSIPRALSEGLMTALDVQDADQVVQALSMQETPWSIDEVDEEVRALAEAYELRWHAGTEHGGEFRPRRGGDPGALIHRLMRRRRMHLPEIASGPAPAAHEPSADHPSAEVTAKIETAKRMAAETGQHHFVVPSAFGHVVSKVRPEDGRDHVEVHPSGATHHVSAEEPPKSHAQRAREHADEAHRLLMGATGGRAVNAVAAHEWGPILAAAEAHIHHADAARAAGEPDAGRGYIMGPITLEKWRKAAKKAGWKPDETPEPPAGFRPVGEEFRAKLAKLGIENATGLKQQQTGRGFKSDYQVIDARGRVHYVDMGDDGELKLHGAKRPPHGPPAPRAGGLTHDHVRQVVEAKKPDRHTLLAPGIHFDPDLKRSETREGHLYLPSGFFGLGKTQREGVVHRHLGRQLAEGLGPEGRKRLADQSEHLRSPKAIAEHYHALNSPGARERMRDVHPEALRLVAQAAHDHGLPLHPDAAQHVGESSLPDKPPEEHPAHALAKRVIGETDVVTQSALTEAGYHFSGTHHGDHPVLTYRNHEHGASITVHYEHGTSPYDTAVEAHVDVSAPVDQATRNRYQGRTMGEVFRELRDQGFDEHLSGTGWHEFIGSDGRGLAMKSEEGGPVAWDEKKVVEVKAFTPSDRQVEKAQSAGRVHRLRQGDFSAIEPGMKLSDVHKLLTDAGFSHARRHAEASGDAPVKIEGADSFSDYAVPGTQPEGLASLAGGERIRIATKGDTVVSVGRPDEHETGTGTADETTYAAARAEQIGRLEDAARGAQEEADQKTRAVLDAVATGDAKKIEAALKGHDLNDAVRLLRDTPGWEVRGRRRGGKYPERTITYTLRGPQGETLKIGGPYTFGNRGVTKVSFKGNPQGGVRERLPRGQVPKAPAELYRDALGRTDELAAREGAAINVTSIHVGSVQRGALAHHEWNGSIAILKRSEQEAKAYLAKRAAGEEVDDRDHLGFYQFVQVLAHEINHGIGKKGPHNGLDFGPNDYAGLGKRIEEAIVEETSHHEAVKWLREMGMEDVLAAAKRNPRDHRVTGTYTDYRRWIGDIFERAGTPEPDRLRLMEDMKYRQTSTERVATLARVLGVEPDDIRTASHLRGRRPSDARREFSPVTRPDLADIEAPPLRVRLLPGGREIGVGDSVTVSVIGDDGQRHPVPGEVIETSGGSAVKIRTEDGLELWYDPRSGRIQ